MRRALLVLATCSVLGCASEREGPGPLDRAAGISGPIAGVAGVVWMASELSYLEPEYLAGMLVAYGIYDPLAPTWSIEVSRSGEDRVRMDLHMKRLASGGDGEARRVFLRNAHELVRAGGFAGFDELSWDVQTRRLREMCAEVVARKRG